MRKQWWMVCLFVCLGLLGNTPAAQAEPVLVNGDFEAGGGSLQGWTNMFQVGSNGNWFVQTGTTSPLTGLAVPPPPGPTHAAMTDQFSPTTAILYQDFKVDPHAYAAGLTFDEFIGNRATAFASPNTLDFTVGGTFAPNQQVRVDIITTTANPFSVAPADVVLNVFQSHPGDPLISGYTTRSFDISSILAGHLGDTLRLRFAVADNQNVLNFGVDRVDLEVIVPEPTTWMLLGAGIAGLAGYGWLRRQRAPRSATTPT
jgi:hypothetical protein